MQSLKGGESLEIKIAAMTIVKIVAVLFVLWLVYYIRDIIATILVALIFASLIMPWADWLEKKKVPRPVSVIIIYIIVFSLLAIVIGLLVPPLVREIKDLAANFSYLWAKIVSSFVSFRAYSETISVLPQAVEKGLSTVETALSQAFRGIFATVTGIFGGIVSFVVILVITFYMVLQEDGLKKFFYSIVPASRAPLLGDLFSKMQKKISLWARGQLILCLTVGVAAFLGLAILGVDYALVLGIFVGITELVPYAGPFLGGAVAVLFALAQSPFKAFLVVILFVVIQQLENNLLVPKVMQKAVGLNPIVSIVALLIGFRLGGIVGALFAIPAATALDVIARELLGKKMDS